MRKFLFRCIGGILLLAGCAVLFADQSTVNIVISTCLWIIGFTIWMMASPQNYNEMLDTQKVVEMQKRPLEELCKALKTLPTPLGHPWMCKLFSIKSPVLVYGPDASGSYIYARWFNGQLLLSGNTDTDMLHPADADAWRLKGGGQRRRAEANIFYEENINIAGILTAYQKLFEAYARANRVPSEQEAAVIFDQAGPLRGKLYVFQEEFKFTGQRFHMVDMDGNVLWDIEGRWPLKTLRILDHNTGEVVFRVTKRILHILAHYDFYAGDDDDQLIGSFRKKLALAHDTFSMQCGDVEITMRSVADTIGANYIVRANGRQIGTIGENLDLSLHNILFDNMVVEVFDDKYTLLMAALAIMSAREMARDREDDDSLTDTLLNK